VHVHLTLNTSWCMFNPSISSRRSVALLFYFIFLSFYAFYMSSYHIISENKRKIISTTYNIWHFSRMLPKIICLRRWEKTSFQHDNARQWFLIFAFNTITVFSCI
jgi:hypothetical protein